MNRRGFQKLAEARLLDAKALLKAKRYDGAIYMAGYVIECVLKACIAKKTRLYDFPPKDSRDYYIHAIEKLMKIAGIEKSLQQDLGENRRYGLRGTTAAEAKALLSAIEDRHHGVLQCLSKYW
jgi:HEPN domain-containing protein